MSFEGYVDDEVSVNRLPPGSILLLREAFIAGESERGRALEITRYQERRGREILSTLLTKSLLASKRPRATIGLGFPLDVVERWFPLLYLVS